MKGAIFVVQPIDTSVTRTKLDCLKIGGGVQSVKSTSAWNIVKKMFSLYRPIIHLTVKSPTLLWSRAS